MNKPKEEKVVEPEINESNDFVLDDW